MITDRKIVVHIISDKEVYNTYHQHDDISGWKSVDSKNADCWRKQNCFYRVVSIGKDKYDKRSGLII